MLMVVVLAGDVTLCCSTAAAVAVVAVLCWLVSWLAMPRCAALPWVWWLCSRGLAMAVLCCLVPWMPMLHCAVLLWSRCGGCAVAAWCSAVLALVLAGDVLSSCGPVALRCCQLHAAA